MNKLLNGPYVTVVPAFNYLFVGVGHQDEHLCKFWPIEEVFEEVCNEGGLADYFASCCVVKNLGVEHEQLINCIDEIGEEVEEDHEHEQQVEQPQEQWVASKHICNIWVSLFNVGYPFLGRVGKVGPNDVFEHLVDVGKQFLHRGEVWIVDLNASHIIEHTEDKHPQSWDQSKFDCRTEKTLGKLHENTKLLVHS